MKIGITAFCTDHTLPPARFSREIEARGFDGLYLPEHTHIPVSRRTPYPAQYGGGELPEFYKRAHDPFVALAAIAEATTRLEIGTCVCLIAQREPIVTAKAISSLDQLSGGRLVLGVGSGWNVDEAEQHGVPWKRRFSMVREKVSVMKRLWAEEIASYEGDFVRLEPCWQWPKPRQLPHPPILLGGGGPITLRHVAEWADGWLPIAGADYEGFGRRVGELRATAEAMGRDPAAIGLSVVGVPPDPAALAGYRELGVERAILRLVAATPDEQLRRLDELAALVGPAG